MARLSLDDFEWDEPEFDRWELVHKRLLFVVAFIRNYEGWHVQVLYDSSHLKPLHVDSLDAAKALAHIITSQYMEKYSAYFNKNAFRRRPKSIGPPPIRSGVFKMD